MKADFFILWCNLHSISWACKHLGRVTWWYIRDAARGRAEGAAAPPDFGRSVNPISTRGGWLCPPQYYLPPRIFNPCCIHEEHTSTEFFTNSHRSEKQLTFSFVFFSDLNEDFSMNKIDGPVKINECILANVSQTEDLTNISRLNLLLSIANEECYQQIKNGRLYLQGTLYTRTVSS